MFRGRSARASYRGRGRGTSSNNNTSARLKGLFADGIWHCDCTPRLPAEHFKVKKEGKNQGRWFYTCQQSEPKRCGFFMWDEAAKQREEAAVLSNSRSEPGVMAVQEGWSAGREGVNGRPAGAAREEVGQSITPPPPYSSAIQNASKRTADEAGLDDEDFFPWPLTGQEEQELARAADSAAPATPHKALKTGVYATPATTGKRKLPWLAQSETPKTSTTDQGYFGTPSKPPVTAPAPTTPSEQPTLPTLTSPSPPTRYKDALHNPADASSTLTSAVLAALKPATIAPDVLSAVRSVVSRHDLKTQGITKGRDVSRLAIKAKDAKISELQARIASLEADREVDRGVIRQLRWQRDNKQDSQGSLTE